MEMMADTRYFFPTFLISKKLKNPKLFIFGVLFKFSRDFCFFFFFLGVTAFAHS